MTSPVPSTSTGFSRIQTDQDLADFRKSPGYLDFIGWIQRRCERVRGKRVDNGSEGCSEKIKSLLDLLSTLTRIMDDTPAEHDPNQRFGNKSFRVFVKKVEEHLLSNPLQNGGLEDIAALNIDTAAKPNANADPSSLSSSSLLPHPESRSSFLPNAPELLRSTVLRIWLEGSAFGHSSRLDYGTGHELAFVLGLWVLVKGGYIGGGSEFEGEGEQREQREKGDLELEEDDLILRVFPKYLTLTNALQTKYKLEPAGSHGVWGLDDYVFLPYLFGSGQLLGVEGMTPTKTLELAKSKEEVDDMWTMALRRLFEFKRGPFFEHSPLLHNLSTSFPNFNKIHSGLFKMYLEEVLNKRVVVQHLPIPDWVWEPEADEEDDRGVRNDDCVAFKSGSSMSHRVL